MIFAISDLHLSESSDKPMDIFGSRWENHTGRLRDNWKAIVAEEDTVLIPGDVSWAMTMEQMKSDFSYLEDLPGHKIISKGNHDYWWATHAKATRFLADNHFDSISILHNNSFIVEGTAICGSRGWICPGDEGFGEADNKIYLRELQRLELSIASLQGPYERLVIVLHYPPYALSTGESGFMDIIRKHSADICLYGHIHTENTRYITDGKMAGVRMKLIAADHLGFVPFNLSDHLA